MDIDLPISFIWSEWEASLKDQPASKISNYSTTLKQQASC